MLPDMFEVTIISRKQETPEILSFELGKKDGSALPTFDAGSHIDVQINAQLVRQYSLYNSPAEHKTYKIAVLKDADSRGGSTAIHQRFQVGDNIRISPPRNLFPLHTGQHRSLLFAGGIGITPLLSMAQTLHQRGQDFELHYFARSEAAAAFCNELKNAAFADKVCFYFSDTVGDKVSAINHALRQPDKDTHLYTCGPSGFMSSIFSAAQAQGWASEQLHKEIFQAEASDTSNSDGSFTLNLARSGISLEIPADKTILEVLEEAGVDIDVSCEQGICGACLTTVLEGTPDHRDQLLSDAEKAMNIQFTPCCSRSLTKHLTIDL